jgi:hypothetical protein
MPESDRHELRIDNLCEKLGVPKDKKYLLRLVTFKKNDSGKYVAYMTDESWSDMGFAIPGWYPIVEEPTFGRNRRDSFFGITNAQEIFQPHEFDFSELDGIKICNVQDAAGPDVPEIQFMVKGNLLRLPIEPQFSKPTCPCDCGDWYSPSYTFNTGLHIDEGAPSAMYIPVYDELLGGSGHRWWAAPASWEWTWSSGIQGVGLSAYIDTWYYASWVVPAIYSPQTAPYCRHKEPPIFNNEICSFYEMAEWYFGIRTGYSITGQRLFLNYTETLYTYTFRSGWNKLGLMGEACYTGNINAPKVGDGGTRENWQESANYSADAPDIPEDLPEGVPTPPGGLPATNVTANLTMSGPFEGLFPPCEPCDCIDTPDKYVPGCTEGGIL